MILSKIHLHNFRNFNEATFDLNPVLTVVLGENARGKTNLLESVYFSINGTGFRETKEEELVRWKEHQAYVEAIWRQQSEIMNFQVSLHLKRDKLEKTFSIHKTKKPAAHYKQFLTQAVLFAPEHIQIISGSPDKRRVYFDTILSQTDTEYKRKLHNYEHAIRRRNKILEHYQSEQKLQEELKFWNEYLEEQAFYLAGRREEYVDFINKRNHLEDKIFEIEYIKNELTQERLQSMFALEKKVRKTMIGPQKDDFHIYLVSGDKKNLHFYGSRSEQRLGVFWLKLAEITFFEEIFHKKPLLLLDDISSELDAKNKKLILDLITKYQTILTTTEEELLHLTDISKSVIKL